MNPWTLIGWALLAVFATASVLILLFVAWAILSRARLRLSAALDHQRQHEATRLTAPAAGQVWISADRTRLSVVYVGQRSIEVREGVAGWLVDPTTWQDMIDRNVYALRAP